MRTDTDTTDVYTANGYKSRADYLAELCDSYPADVVHTLADLLGETEDFDGLVTMLEDFSETEAESDDDAAAAATGFREALAARNAARAAYTAASARLDAASDAANAARHAIDAAEDAYSAARWEHIEARDVYAAASAALDTAD